MGNLTPAVINLSLHFLAQRESLEVTQQRRNSLSPTILRIKGYRFFFFSLEETRMHIHVRFKSGEAKFWLEPDVHLARNHHIPEVQLHEIQRIVESHKDEFIAAWHKHFLT